jgi:hypothetical protein
MPNIVHSLPSGAEVSFDSLDSLAAKVLTWVNARRDYRGAAPLEDLHECGALHDDPVTGSIAPDAVWCLGKIQYWYDGSLIQIPVPDEIHAFLAEWRAGAFPQYD